MWVWRLVTVLLIVLFACAAAPQATEATIDRVSDEIALPDDLTVRRYASDRFAGVLRDNKLSARARS